MIKQNYQTTKERLIELEKRFPLKSAIKDKSKFYSLMDKHFDLDDPAMN